MEAHVRAVIAYVVGRLVTGKTSSAIYDYSESAFRSIDGQVMANTIDVFDYKAHCHCHFGGTGNGTSFSLFHYGDRHHVDLTITGTHFEGFDYGSRGHYSGDVSRDTTSLYDHKLQKHFSYTL